MEKLRQLMPQLGDMVRALALSKAEWDIDQAVAMLRSFQVSHLDKVNTLNKVGGGGAAAVACTVGEAATAVTASSVPLWADTASGRAVAGHTCNDRKVVTAMLLPMSHVRSTIPTPTLRSALQRRKKLREAMEACTGSEEPEAGGSGASSSSDGDKDSGSSSSSGSDSEGERRASKVSASTPRGS